MYLNPESSNIVQKDAFLCVIGDSMCLFVFLWCVLSRNKKIYKKKGNGKGLQMIYEIVFLFLYFISKMYIRRCGNKLYKQDRSWLDFSRPAIGVRKNAFCICGHGLIVLLSRNETLFWCFIYPLEAALICACFSTPRIITLLETQWLRFSGC